MVRWIAKKERRFPKHFTAERRKGNKMNPFFDTAPDHRKNGSYRWEQPAGRDDVIGMGTADLDYCCPECVKEACLAIAQENTYNYRKKPDSYFQIVTDWYRRKYGLLAEKEWLSNVPSTIGAIRIALSALTRPGDAVIMQSPFFGPLPRAVESAGCRLVENPMIRQDGVYALDFADFEQKLRDEKPSIFLLVNPHNPTGRVFSPKELERLVALCEQYDVKIISDEVHGLIIYPGKKHIPVLAVSPAARRLSVQVMSMSKGFNLMSLPHAIVAVADPVLRAAWNDEVIPYSFGYATNPFSMAAAAKVMDGSADQWLSDLTDYLKENRDLAVSFLQNEVPGMRATVPEGSFLLWIDCSELGLENPAEFLLEKAGVSVNDGAEFGNAYGQFIRMNFALTRQNLQTALDRIKKAVAAR